MVCRSRGTQASSQPVRVRCICVEHKSGESLSRGSLRGAKVCAWAPSSVCSNMISDPECADAGGEASRQELESVLRSKAKFVVFRPPQRPRKCPLGWILGMTRTAVNRSFSLKPLGLRQLTGLCGSEPRGKEEAPAHGLGGGCAGLRIPPPGREEAESGGVRPWSSPPPGSSPELHPPRSLAPAGGGEPGAQAGVRAQPPPLPVSRRRGVGPGRHQDREAGEPRGASAGRRGCQDRDFGGAPKAEPGGPSRVGMSRNPSPGAEGQ